MDSTNQFKQSASPKVEKSVGVRQIIRETLHLLPRFIQWLRHGTGESAFGLFQRAISLTLSLSKNLLRQKRFQDPCPQVGIEFAALS
ncbi:MAG: hypothetical protein ACI87E_003292 [Mariniblastus sp.]|jgi:hypothetical protein